MQPTDHATWQAANLDALQQRLAPLLRRKDGTLLTEMAGIHFLVVTKEGTSLRFWLMEQSKPSTGVIQSEIDLADPLILMEAYTQAMLLSLLWQPDPTAVYMAGFGGGRIPTILHHHFPTATIISTDIDPQVVTLAERFFGVRQDERLQVFVQDGRVWLEQHEQEFDLILLDVFLDNGYTPYRMATVEFFTLCRDRLRPGGVLALNLLPGDSQIDAKIAGLAAVFPDLVLYTHPHENLVCFAGEQLPLDYATIRTHAQELATGLGLAFPYAEHVPFLSPVPSYRLATALHDDRPPTNHLAQLPSFDSPFSRPADHLPCPCGSGLSFAACHGLPKS